MSLNSQLKTFQEHSTSLGGMKHKILVTHKISYVYLFPGSHPAASCVLLCVRAPVLLHRQHRPPGCSPCLECCPGSWALASCCLRANLSFSMRPTLTTLLHTTGSHPTSSSSLSWLKLSFSSFRSIYQHLTCHKIYLSCLLSHLPQTAGKFHEVRDFLSFFLSLIYSQRWEQC